MHDLKNLLGEYLFGTEANAFYKQHIKFENEFFLRYDPNSIEVNIEIDRDYYLRKKWFCNFMLLGGIGYYIAENEPIFSTILIIVSEIKRLKFYSDFLKHQESLLWRQNYFIDREINEDIHRENSRRDDL